MISNPRNSCARWSCSHYTDEETEAARKCDSRAQPSLLSHSLQLVYPSDCKDPLLGLSPVPGSPGTDSAISLFLGLNRASLIFFLFPFPIIIIHFIIRATHLRLLALAHRLFLPGSMQSSVWPHCISKMALWPCACGPGWSRCHQRTAGVSPDRAEVRQLADAALRSGSVFLVPGLINICLQRVSVHRPRCSLPPSFPP